MESNIEFIKINAFFHKFSNDIPTSLLTIVLSTFLLLKMISDIHKKEFQELQNKISDETLLKRRAQRLRFALEDDTNFDYLYEHRLNPGLGMTINNLLLKIERLNPEKFQGVLSLIDFNSSYILGAEPQKTNCLIEIIELFKNINYDFQNTTEIEDFYKILLPYLAIYPETNKQIFDTPKGVCDLLARLTITESVSNVFDPSASSGGLLLSAAKMLNDSNASFLYAKESDRNMWAMSKIKMILHGFDNVLIENKDVFEKSNYFSDSDNKKFDCILTNIPFSAKASPDTLKDYIERGGFKWGIPPKNRLDYGFIQNIINSLEDNGVGAVIVHPGVLFREGTEKKIRENILKDNLIDTIIALPSNLFYATGISTAIFILRKNKSDKDVFFIDASNDYELLKPNRILRTCDIEKIVSTYKNKECIKGYSHNASFEEIESNDFNLNISRYVFDNKQKDFYNMDEKKNEIKNLECELSFVSNELSQLINFDESRK